MSSLFFLLIAGHCYFGSLHNSKTKPWPAEKLHYVCILNQHLDPFCSVWTLPTCWWPEVWRETNPQQLHSHRPGREAEGFPLPPAQTPAGVRQRRPERSARSWPQSGLPGRRRRCNSGEPGRSETFPRTVSPKSSVTDEGVHRAARSSVRVWRSRRRSRRN